MTNKSLSNSSLFSVSDIKNLSCLNLDEIKYFNNHPMLKKQVITLQEWMRLSIDSNSDNFQAISDEIGEALGVKFIKNPEDLSRIFETITETQCNTVINFCRKFLLNTVKNGADFGDALENLTIEQRTKMYHLFKDKIACIAKDSIDLGCFIMYLTPDQCTQVCSIFIEKNIDVIKNIDDFGWLLQYLTPEQCGVVCRVFKSKLSKIIDNVEDLKKLITFLLPEHHRIIFTLPEINSQLPRLITRINVDVPNLYASIDDRIGKKLFLGSLFNGLLQDLNYAGDIHCEHKHTIAELYSYLENESKKYFDSKTPGCYSFENFKMKCNDKITQVKISLRENESIALVLTKILLTISTFGTILLASTLKSKYETGVFRCRLFEAKGEREVDDFSRLLNIPSGMR